MLKKRIHSNRSHQPTSTAGTFANSKRNISSLNRSRLFFWLSMSSLIFLFVHIFASSKIDITADDDGISNSSINALHPKNEFNKTSSMDILNMHPKELTDVPLKSRVYPIYKHPFPCILVNDDKHSHSSLETGITFIKIHKCGSTTVADIVSSWRNVFRNKHNITSPTMHCKTYFHHMMAYKLHGLAHRQREKSFLFTFIREPTERFKSDFYYHGISKAKRYDNASLENFQHFAKSQLEKRTRYGGYMMHFMTMDNSTLPSFRDKFAFWNPEQSDYIQNSNILLRHVETLIQEYDFIGIMSRMDESLVVLSMILDIPMRHVLYLNRRQSGSFDYDFSRNQCFFVEKPKASLELEQYLKSDEWYSKNAGDFLLYRAAHESLDRTIDSIGRSRFEEKLKIFKELKAQMGLICDINCSRCTNKGEVRDKSFKQNPKCSLQACAEMTKRVMKRKKNT